MSRARTFDDLVAEAEPVDVSGWGFGWLDGRAVEPRARHGHRWRGGAGGGPTLPERMCVTEAWPPNLRRAREVLGPRGVDVRATEHGAPLPFPDESFELVTARHPVRPDWPEIRHQHGRDPQREAAQARAAGLSLTDLRTARCRMQFFDIGAVVWILRKCV